MAKSLETWKKQVFGNTVDLDNQSYDCVDVSKSWIVYLSDKPWQESAGWGNAKDIYYYWSSTYLSQVPRGNAPQPGDIVCMNGQIGGGFGHTGVVVAVDGQNITIYQQNTFTQQPVYTGVYNAYTTYIIGFLRPKVDFTVADEPMQAYQRTVGAGGVHYRTQPNTTAPDMQPVFAAGETLDFKGFVHGEKVDGNDVWFVGRYTGGYSWSGGFTDAGTHDLQDLTPTQLQGFQRQVGNSIINYRKLPQLAPDNVIKTFQPGEVLDFDAWTHGTNVDGTDIWFRGKYTQGWSHAGGFTDQGTHDLTEVTLNVTPTPVDPPSSDLSAKVVDISNNNKVTDHAALKAAVRGVVHKAGHTGKSYGGIQPQNGDPNFSAAKSALSDKLVGAYWYAYCSLDPEVEAQAFVDTVGKVSNDFVYWLDIEESDGQSNDQINAWCVKFMNKVDTLTNKVCEMYMNRNWYNTVITSATKGSRKIWLADFTVAEMTNPVANQVGHQYTNKGSVAGVEGYVDVTSVTDAFFKATVIAPPDPTDPNNPSDPTDPTKNPLWKVFVAFVDFLKSIIDKLTSKNNK